MPGNRRSHLTRQGTLARPSSHPSPAGGPQSMPRACLPCPPQGLRSLSQPGRTNTSSHIAPMRTRLMGKASSLGVPGPPGPWEGDGCSLGSPPFWLLCVLSARRVPWNTHWEKGQKRPRSLALSLSLVKTRRPKYLADPCVVSLRWAQWGRGDPPPTWQGSSRPPHSPEEGAKRTVSPTCCQVSRGAPGPACQTLSPPSSSAPNPPVGQCSGPQGSGRSERS